MNISNQTTKAKVKFITEFFSENPTATVESCRRVVAKIYGRALRSQVLHDLKKSVVSRNGSFAKAPAKSTKSEPTKAASVLPSTARLKELVSALKNDLPDVTNLQIIRNKSGNYQVDYSLEKTVIGSFTLPL